MPPKMTELERVHVTLPAELMDSLREAAAREDRPVSAEIARRLRKSLEVNKKGQQR